MAHVHLIANLCIAACVACCGGAPIVPVGEAPRPRPVPQLLVSTPPPFGSDAPPVRVVSKRLQLSIPLPDRPGWQIAREKSSFLVLDHAATGSRLLFSLWAGDAVMSPDACEERARMLRELPKRGRIIGSQMVEAPAGFSTRIDVGVDASSQPGEAIGGHLLAFGAAHRRCFAMVFATTGLGPDAEREVGDRLATIQSVTLEGVRLVSDLEVVP